MNKIISSLALVGLVSLAACNQKEAPKTEVKTPEPAKVEAPAVVEAPVAEAAAAPVEAAPAEEVPGVAIDGEKVFSTTCMMCHQPEVAGIGPSVKEMKEIYAGNPEGIVTWSQKPGKKREGMAMPAQTIPVEELRAAAEYILK